VDRREGSEVLLGRWDCDACVGVRLLSLGICDVGRGGRGVCGLDSSLCRWPEGTRLPFGLAALTLCATTPVLEPGAWTSRRGVWGME
jgi:hypothetical protein